MFSIETLRASQLYGPLLLSLVFEFECTGLQMSVSRALPRILEDS